MTMTGEGGRDEKNAMALKEINSNEEPNHSGRQLLMLLPNETVPPAMATYGISMNRIKNQAKTKRYPTCDHAIRDIQAL